MYTFDFSKLENLTVCDFHRNGVRVEGKKIISEFAPLWLVIYERKKTDKSDFFHFLCGVDICKDGFFVGLGDREIHQTCEEAIDFLIEAYKDYPYSEGNGDISSVDFHLNLEEYQYEDFYDEDTCQDSFRCYWQDTKKYLETGEYR